MKKLLFVIVAVALTASFAFTTVQEKQKNLATVSRVQGYYIFIQSQPVLDYEVLGSIKSPGVVWSGKPEAMYNTLLKRMKKEYPRADGIIFDDVAMEHATCIQFK